MLTLILSIALYYVAFQIIRNDMPTSPTSPTSPSINTFTLGWEEDTTVSEQVQFLVDTIPGLTTASQLKSIPVASLESISTLLSNLPPKS
jgi:hypothetical protein